MTDESFTVKRSDAKCTSPRTGKLINSYFGGWLTQQNKAAVEQHIKECKKCNAVFVSLRNFTAAAKRMAKKGSNSD